LCGGLGLPASVSVPAITGLGAAGCGVAAWRRRQWPLPASGRPPLVVLVVLAAAIAWSSGVAGRTHLGWDGTVVWYHKARILAATGGAMPSATLADRTRAWTAPDYPLHVPLALAWVRVWQPEEDERAIKVLPAAWAAALLLVVAAAVLERSRSATAGAAAIVILATMPRLLIGEGSLTSGYGDGPFAALLAALTWIVWRCDAGDVDGAWGPLLALLALAIVCTKQEGLVAVLAAAAAQAWIGARSGQWWSRISFAFPALGAAITWHAWTAWHGAPSGMAYEWPGAVAALARIGPIATAYGSEWLDVRTWGVFWPGVTIVLWIHRTSLPNAPLVMLVTLTFFGALAFVWSDWPSVSMHLHVTVPRLTAATVPSIVVLAFGAARST